MTRADLIVAIDTELGRHPAPRPTLIWAAIVARQHLERRESPSAAEIRAEVEQLLANRPRELD